MNEQTTRPVLTAQLTITDLGALGDDRSINTVAIQCGIDRLSQHGGGTLVVPKGVFVTGALFFKPRVNLHLEKDAVLRCSTEVAENFPAQRTRVEGTWHEKFTPALINVDGCDGFQLTGEGTLDGNGRPIWDLFWKLRNAAPDPKNFRNVSIPRARLAFIQNSKDVVIQGVTFKDSQFWNLHLYHCQNVLVQNAGFQVPDDYKQAPSTDGIDVDSCQRVTISGCLFSVTDDCIAMKGSRGPLAMEDQTAPPVEHVRISGCTFKRGHGVLTLGSEATIVRDVVIEDCVVTGSPTVAVLKLRADTPQHYEDIHYRNITVDNASGKLIAIEPWGQYIDLKGQPPPKSVVRYIAFSNIKGRYGSFGTIAPNPGQTEISDIRLENFEVQLKDGVLKDAGVTQFNHVIVNGKAYPPGTE